MRDGLNDLLRGVAYWIGIAAAAAYVWTSIPLVP